ncbi:GDSL family lipase [Thalassobacter sp. 16PALIMAR09]|nr:GDSL family lipase [Thalassobacter sp. 16PALIMAR09]
MVAAQAKAIVVSIFMVLPVMGGAAAEPITVAALGDSLTQGYGLPPEQGFVPQLEGWLRARGADVSILNAGVSGDTTAGGLSRIAWTLTPEVDAVIVALGGNDLLRGIAPEVSRANLDDILQATQNAGVPVLLIGLPAPGNYGPDYQREFNGIYPALAQAYDTLYAEDFLAGLGENTPQALRSYMQADGIHPNAAGVTKIVETLGPEVEALLAQVRP